MLPSPVALAAVMTTASDTVRQLINVDRGPELNVIVGRAYDRGVRVEAGRRFRHAELEAISVGDPIPPGEAGDAGAAFFTKSFRLLSSSLRPSRLRVCIQA